MAERVVETDRLLLRPYGRDDYEAVRAMSADPESFRFSERGPMSDEEAWTRLLRHAGCWSLLGYGLFAIEEKASRRVIGEAGFSDFHRGLGPGFDGLPEASWTVIADKQRRGYATEAARGALHWLETRFAAARTVCLIHAENAPSLRVAEKLGYRAFDERIYRGYPAILFARS